jgi:hypothetical protein
MPHGGTPFTALVRWLTAATTVVLVAGFRALSASPVDQAQLAVHVVTPEGDNVPGAVIAIEDGGHRAVTASGDDGQSTTNLAAGTYGLVVSMTGYLSTRVLVRLPPSGLSREIVLSRAATVSGRALFSGRSIPGVSVTAGCRSENGGRPVSVSADTDDRGEYHLSGLPVRSICTVTGRTRQAGVMVRPLDAPLPIGDTPHLQVDLFLDAVPRPAAPPSLSPPMDDRPTTTVRGIVVEKGTRSAIPLASIRIFDDVAHTVRNGGTTDRLGHFEFTLVPGRYRLMASRADFDSDTTLSSVRLVVPDNSHQTVLDVELPLTRGAVIAGKVLHISGQPLVGATIRVYRNQSLSGHVHPLIVTTSGATSTTDENGEFRLYGLRAGTYFVAASESGYEQQGSWSQYHPGGGIAIAQPVAVAASDVLDGVDITWASEQTSGVIQGTVNAGDGVSATDVVVTATPSVQSSLPMSAGTAVRIDRSGHFTITGLDEGSYVVKAATSSNEGVSAFGFARTSIAGGIPSNVSITIEPAKTLSGQVVTRGPDGVLRPVADLLIGAFPFDVDEYPDHASAPVARADEKGAFTMRLAGGPALFRLATPSDWYVRAVSSSGGDVTDIGLLATGHSSIVVEVTKQISRVSGTVKTRAGASVAHASVVIVSSDPSRVRRWSRFAAVAQCDAEGSWSYNGLPAGQYFVFSTPALIPEEIDLQDRQWLQTYVGRATLVTVSEDSTTQVSLQSDDH